MVVMVLERMGATVQARGGMYKAVAKSVLLYGSKSCVVTGYIIKVLTGFHHRAAQRIAEMTAKSGAGIEGEYPSVVDAMEVAGLRPIGVYIKRRQTTILERVACRPVYAICTYVEQILVMSRLVQWWDQCAVNEPEE